MARRSKFGADDTGTLRRNERDSTETMQHSSCLVPGDGDMRSVEEYLRRAAEFERIANESMHPSLKKRYADLADCYRLLADERRRLISEGLVANEGGPLDEPGSARSA
jgi:hypothetical protein